MSNWKVEQSNGADSVVLRHPSVSGHVEVTRTDEGIVVDVWPKNGRSSLVSCWATADELEEDEDEAIF